jgi:hypothetical protein
MQMRMSSWSLFARMGLMLSIGWLPAPGAFAAAEPSWQVSVDRTSLGQDESLSLKFSIRAEGALSIGEPQFEASGFDEVNQYSNVFVESYYENGRFGVRNNKSVTKVLRPSRQGTLEITGIRININGKFLEHPPIRIEVLAPGQGTPPPQRYGGGGMGLRGSAKRTPTVPFTIRAELDRSRAYKGQQVIVSYYLYRRARLFNIQVQKYPILDGFLREDLDLPILGQRLQSESVVVDGVSYERSLLARYAAYPLKEGRLPIDSMTIKGNYYPGTGSDFDLDNPIQSFFQQMQPREWSHRSDRIDLEVLPLPTEGRPPSFTGGVGDFSIETAIDRNGVRANEALSITYKIEGTGNVAGITEPKVAWPAEVEVFESKSRMLPARAGVSTKVFEVIVIPRKPGPLTIPGAEFSYFSVKDRGYRTLKSAGHEVEVTPGGGAAAGESGGVAAGSPQTARPDPGAATPVISAEDWKVRTWMGRRASGPLWWLILGLLALSGAVLGVRALAGMRRKWKILRAVRGTDSKLERNREWETLQRFITRDSAQAPWNQVVQAYDSLSQRLLISIEEATKIPARALSRDDLSRRGLEETPGEEALWKRICLLLEYCEWVRFGASAGMVTEPEARSRLAGWLVELQRLEALIAGLSHRLKERSLGSGGEGA